MPRRPSRRGLRVRWERPVVPGGPSPLAILLNWFPRNRDVYHQAKNRRALLKELRQHLRDQNIMCGVDALSEKIERLREVADETTRNVHLPKVLRPYRARLLYCFLSDEQHRGELDERREDAERESARGSKDGRERDQRMSWMELSPMGGESAMSLLVSWLREHYDAYTKATPEGRQQSLEQVCAVIRSAGHEHCTVWRVYSKIKCLKSEAANAALDPSHCYTAAFDRYKGILVGLFGHHATRGTDRDGSVEDDGDSSMSYTDEDDSEGEDVDMSEVDEIDGESEEEDTSDVEDAAAAGVEAQAGNKARKRNKFSWTKPSKTDGQSKIEILMPWLVTNYANDVRPRRGEIQPILEQLLVTMKEAGHDECTLAQIRTKINTLQREATGKKQKSEVFERYEQILVKLFRDGVAREELERYISSSSCLNEDSDEAMREDDDEDRTDAVAPVEDLEISAEGELLPPNQETASQSHEDEANMDTISNQARPAQPGNPRSRASPLPELEESTTESIVGSQTSEAEVDPKAQFSRFPSITPTHASVEVMEHVETDIGDDCEAHASAEGNHVLALENELDDSENYGRLEVGAHKKLSGAAEASRLHSKSHPEDTDMDTEESESAAATDNAMEGGEVPANNNCWIPAPQTEPHPRAGSILERAQPQANDGVVTMAEDCQERPQPDMVDTSAENRFNLTGYGDPTHHPEAFSLHGGSHQDPLRCPLDLQNRRHAVSCRNKLRLARVSNRDIDTLIPKPESNTNYQLGRAALDVRTEVGLKRAELQNAGAPASEINLLPLPDRNIGNYHFTIHGIRTLALWVRERQKARDEGGLENDINTFVPLPT